MSDTEKRDAVLALMEEFRMTWVQQSAPNGYAMVAEIARLRDENAAQRAEINRLRAILAALREPSKEVWGAALEAYNHALFATHTPRLISAIRAAVAAAEQEVDDRTPLTNDL